MASRAGRAGPGRHRLELDLGAICGGQMEVDLGAIPGGPNHLFALSLHFNNWVHLQVQRGLGLGSASQPALKKNAYE